MASAVALHRKAAKEAALEQRTQNQLRYRYLAFAKQLKTRHTLAQQQAYRHFASGKTADGLIAVSPKAEQLCLDDLVAMARG